MLAMVSCDASQAWRTPCVCISVIFCASAALRRFSCSTSLLVFVLVSSCCWVRAAFAVAFIVLAARYWPIAVRQSGEIASEVSIMASCESWVLFPAGWACRYVVVEDLTGILAVLHAW